MELRSVRSPGMWLTVLCLLLAQCVCDDIKKPTHEPQAVPPQWVDLFPIAVGNRWTYKFTTSITTQTSTTTIEGPVTLELVERLSSSGSDNVMMKARETAALTGTYWHYVLPDSTWAVLDTIEYTLSPAPDGMIRKGPSRESRIFIDSLNFYRYVDKANLDTLAYIYNLPSWRYEPPDRYTWWKAGERYPWVFIYYRADVGLTGASSSTSGGHSGSSRKGISLQDYHLNTDGLILWPVD